MTKVQKATINKGNMVSILTSATDIVEALWMIDADWNKSLEWISKKEEDYIYEVRANKTNMCICKKFAGYICLLTDAKIIIEDILALSNS